MNNHYPHYPPPYPYALPPQPGMVYASYPANGVQTPQVPIAAVNPPPVAPANSSLLGSSFVKGALFGAVAAYLLTNETVQQGAIKAAVKSWSLVQGGVEEMKERFRDAEAELHASDLDEE